MSNSSNLGIKQIKILTNSKWKDVKQSVSEPVKDQFMFNKWTLDLNGNNQIQDNFLFERDTTLYAQYVYIPKTYKIRIHNGNQIQEFSCLETETLFEKVGSLSFTKQNFEFECLSLDPNSTEAADLEIKPNKDVDLFVIWKFKLYVFIQNNLNNLITFQNHCLEITCFENENITYDKIKTAIFENDIIKNFKNQYLKLDFNKNIYNSENNILTNEDLLNGSQNIYLNLTLPNTKLQIACYNENFISASDAIIKEVTIPIYCSTNDILNTLLENYSLPNSVNKLGFCKIEHPLIQYIQFTDDVLSIQDLQKEFNKIYFCVQSKNNLEIKQYLGGNSPNILQPIWPFFTRRIAFALFEQWKKYTNQFPEWQLSNYIFSDPNQIKTKINEPDFVHVFSLFPTTDLNNNLIDALPLNQTNLNKYIFNEYFKYSLDNTSELLVFCVKNWTQKHIIIAWNAQNQNETMYKHITVSKQFISEENSTLNVIIDIKKNPSYRFSFNEDGKSILLAKFNKDFAQDEPFSVFDLQIYNVRKEDIEVSKEQMCLTSKALPATITSSSWCSKYPYSLKKFVFWDGETNPSPDSSSNSFKKVKVTRINIDLSRIEEFVE